MRALPVLALLVIFGVLTAGCGDSGGSSFVATPPPTPHPLDALTAQAAPLCTAAASGTAQRRQAAPAAPIASYLRQDNSGLDRSYQTDIVQREWKPYTGATYKVLNTYETEWLQGFRLERVEDVRSIVCISEQWIAAGTYERSGTLGVRKDWTVYILAWPDGAILVERTFRGGDPPANRETTAGTGGCSTCTEPGKPPAKDAHAWLHSLLDGPAATTTAAPLTVTATAARTATPATAARTPAPPTAIATATRTPSPTAGGGVPGCTLCGVHNLPNSVTLEVRVNAYEGWSLSADGRELTLRVRRGATARVQGATCTELDPLTLRCTLTPGSRVIADGTAP